MTGEQQIFYDPRHRRWRRFTRVLWLASAVVSAIFGALVAAVLVNPALPVLGLPSSRALPAARHVIPSPADMKPKRPLEARLAREKKRLRAEIAATPTPVRASGQTAAGPRRAAPSRLLGFYVNWDDTSFSSLKENVGRIDELIPEWLHLADAQGALSADDPTTTASVLAFLRQARPGLPIAPLVNNFNSQTMQWESARLGAMLASPAARSAAVAGLLRFVERQRFAGISVDFEAVPRERHPELLAFMRELYAAFHTRGLEVSQSVPLDDTDFDYAGLATSNDFLILMAYDEHTGDGDAGPVASQGWYRNALAQRFRELPPEKWVVAIGNYGYDWPVGGGAATEVSFQEALRIARDSEGEIALDPESLNPSFSYRDEKNRLRRVWFLNALTAFNQVVEASGRGPRGFALWRLGSEDPSIWQVFARRAALGRDTAMDLRTLHYGYDIDYEGVGEVLRVTATPADGVREVDFDPRSGLIVGERLRSYPSPYVITRWGGTPPTRRIALTFDDGPDPSATPAILDILRREHVPATFFVIGLNADRYPGLLARIDAEGHEIGNHTFTHPNIAMIRERQLSLEVNATERLFESRLGRGSVLFRPPYAEDVEPETPAQVRPLLFTSGRGYYTIGMQIDPGDWKTPGVDRIVAATVEGADRGDGNVVLLHDGGGDRSQTVAALPRIIESLRQRRFELVPVSDLIGVTRDAVMPRIPQRGRASAAIDDAAFLLLSWGAATIRFLFIAGILLGMGRLSIVGGLAIAGWLRSRRRTFPGPLPSVAVVVPAYNEEMVVVRTIEALLASDMPGFEIVVVDDGSTDQTRARVEASFSGNLRVRLFSCANAGKASALNYGIERTGAEIVIALDADTLFRPNAVRLLARHFQDPSVAAVAGNAKVGNRVNLLTNLQALEYITSQNLDRRAFEVLNSISVVPGAIGAWRRSLVLEAGGFSGETLAEDADLTLAIVRRGYRVRYEERAIAWTEAPDTVSGLLKQRFRWTFGTLQAAWKHLDTFLRPRYRGLGLFALPNLFLFQVLFPLIAPVMDLVMVASLAIAALEGKQHPDAPDSSWKTVLFYYALFLAVDVLASALAFLLEKREDWRLLAWLFLQRLVYRPLLCYVALRSVLTAVRGPIVGWGKLERKATVREGS